MSNAENRPHGLMFHHFHNETHSEGQGAISEQQFASILQDYQQHHRLLSAQDWRDRALAGTLEPSDVCLTFDDALLCQYEIAVPVLERFGLTAFWFVYSSVISGGCEKLEVYRKFRTTCFANIDSFYDSFFAAVAGSAHGASCRQALSLFSPANYLASFPFYTDQDRRFRFVRDQVLGTKAYNQVLDGMMEAQQIDLEAFTKDLWMTPAQVQTLHRGGHVVGLHSHTHPTALADLPADAQRTEYQRNYQVLSELLGEQPNTMSHPCNSYNASTLTILEELQIDLGFRSNMDRGPNSALEYPREDHANIIARMRGMAA